jgi:hypothetical protein
MGSVFSVNRTVELHDVRFDFKILSHVDLNLFCRVPGTASVGSYLQRSPTTLII